LTPLLTAFVVAAVVTFAVRADLVDSGSRPLIAALVVFLPGTTMTTGVAELATGQIVAGASRLVAGVVQLAFLAFGILAGIEVVGGDAKTVFADPAEHLGGWAAWVGVAVFATGMAVSCCVPTRSFPALLAVLYAATAAQVAGNVVAGPYTSAFVGALVLIVAATALAATPAALPAHAAFVPGYWLLVPGALALTGFTRFAEDRTVGGQELTAAIVSVFAVAIGVLCGTACVAIVSGGRAPGAPRRS
jgi:uncharacterized membrane protein YjjB (DUF3815 family)